MIGNITQQNSSPFYQTNRNIYIMDTRNYTWVDYFELSTNTTTQPSPTAPVIIVTNSESKSVTIKKIIAAIGGIVGATIIIVCGLLIYKWNEHKKNLSTFRTAKHTDKEHNLSEVVM
ncbi:7459_t:CDS:1 [Funneliformis mosseae]|uniref:7459_t:CDS:1 n=1 Tax=Funneliformis mosseae TaxID=27381 RepID=A0A9N9DNJ4_FUNMO|nr:7459_t:CDS:1 [Funneliformis mosseae]